MELSELEQMKLQNVQKDIQLAQMKIELIYQASQAKVAELEALKKEILKDKPLMVVTFNCQKQIFGLAPKPDKEYEQNDSSN